jgi:hypothetical protein
MDKPVNYTREAFLHPLNLGFLIAAFTTAFFVSGNPAAMNIVFMVTMASELFYLGIVPGMARFQKYINLNKFKERNSKFDERKIFSGLTEESQKRFLVLKHISGLVRENFRKLPYASHGILDSIYTRMDSLNTSYMLLLDSNQRYSQYMNKSVETTLEDEIKATEKEIEESESVKLTQVLNRRLSILNKRLGKYGAAREKYMISESQLKTIEDTVRYIYEKSMTMSNLEEIEYQMDSLLMDLDDADAVFQEINHEMSEIPDFLRNLEAIENDLAEQEQTSRSKIKSNGS